jgi:hypothetical protein
MSLDWFMLLEPMLEPLLPEFIEPEFIEPEEPEPDLFIIVPDDVPADVRGAPSAAPWAAGVGVELLMVEPLAPAAPDCAWAKAVPAVSKAMAAT